MGDQEPYTLEGFEETQSNLHGQPLHSGLERKTQSGGVFSFDAMDALDFLIKRKSLPILLAAAGLLLGIFFAALNVYTSAVNNYKYSIQFAFPGVEHGLYPDFTKFSIQDIIAPTILDDVYRQNSVADYEISLSEFSKSFQIIPLAENRQAIIAKYDVIFDSRKSSLADVRENQEAMNNELRAEARRAATIIYRDASLNMPATSAAKILADVATAWADHAINIRGVISLDLEAPQPEEFDRLAIADMDRINVLRSMDNLYKQLSQFLENLSDQPNGQDIIDPETGKTTLALNNDLKNNLLQVKTLASSWATTYADEYAYLAGPVNLFSESIFIPDNADATDYLISLDQIEDARAALLLNIKQIQTGYDKMSVRDLKSGLSVHDMMRFTQRLKQYDLTQLRAMVLNNSFVKDKQSLVEYYQAVLRDLESEKTELQARARNLDDALKQQLDQTQSAGFSGTLNDTSAPELDTAFLDRLLALSGQTERDEFVRELVSQGLSLNTELVKIVAKIDRIKSDLLIINSDVSSGTGTKRISAEAVEKQIIAIAARLQNYATAIENISSRVTLAREIHGVLEHPETPQFDVTFYLRNATPSTIDMGMLIESIRDIAAASLRIEDLLNQSSAASGRALFNPISSAERESSVPISNRAIAFAILLSILGFLIGLCILAMIYFSKLWTAKGRPHRAA